jgi:hypothetical protein
LAWIDSSICIYSMVCGAAGVRFFSECFQKILKMSKTENEEKYHFLHKRLKN